MKSNHIKPTEPVAATDSRADHDHQAVAEGADADHEVGQRQPELQQADGPLVVVKAVEQDGVFAVALRKKNVIVYFLHLLLDSL